MAATHVTLTFQRLERGHGVDLSLVTSWPRVKPLLPSQATSLTRRALLLRLTDTVPSTALRREHWNTLEHTRPRWKPWNTLKPPVPLDHTGSTGTLSKNKDWAHWKKTGTAKH